MVLLLVGIILACGALIWLWKVPVKNLVTAMKKSGSSMVEAYTVLFLLTAGIALVIYMIVEVV